METSVKITKKFSIAQMLNMATELRNKYGRYVEIEVNAKATSNMQENAVSSYDIYIASNIDIDAIFIYCISWSALQESYLVLMSNDLS